MINDVIVEEIRKHRQEHAERYGYDLRRIVEVLQDKERHSSHRIINPGPKFLQMPAVSNSEQP